MSKFDSQDAYKLIPAAVKDLRIQGFSWLGKFFTENKQIFGARTSVANYDMLGNLVRTLALTRSEIPSELVHRHLDDIPLVAPANKDWCQSFSKEYEIICRNINIKLAENCPKLEKAFVNSTRGKVLGIIFNTTNLSWELPEDKRTKCLQKIHDALYGERVSLLQMQKLMGYLNFVGQLCPFIAGFKNPLNRVLAQLQEKPTQTCNLSQAAKKDLSVWAAFILDPEKQYPIAPRPTNPPLYHKTFISDAAGFSPENPEVGVGVLGLNEGGGRYFGLTKCNGKKTSYLKLVTKRVVGLAARRQHWS